MRRVLSALIDKLCRARTRHRLKQYGMGTGCLTLDQLQYELDSVPGMMASEAGPLLFILSAVQELSGDVIEIGSWQGRSTIYLAKGAQVASNGRVYAIDHFLGNPGKESLYRAKQEDLSDLQSLFREHVRLFHTSQTVEMMPMSSTSAALVLKESSVRARLVFIDGNHEFEGVTQDFEAVRPILLPLSLVVFDDFSPAFPGVVKCINQLIERKIVQPRFSYANCFVGQYMGNRQDEPLGSRDGMD